MLKEEYIEEVVLVLRLVMRRNHFQPQFGGSSFTKVTAANENVIDLNGQNSVSHLFVNQI